MLTRSSGRIFNPMRYIGNTRIYTIKFCIQFRGRKNERKSTMWINEFQISEFEQTFPVKFSSKDHCR